MNHRTAQAIGFVVGGTGQLGGREVESGCKQIGTMRLKRSGIQWGKDGARLVAKARAVWLSCQWHEGAHAYHFLPFAP